MPTHLQFAVYAEHVETPMGKLSVTLAAFQPGVVRAVEVLCCLRELGLPELRAAATGKLLVEFCVEEIPLAFLHLIGFEYHPEGAAPVRVMGIEDREVKEAFRGRGLGMAQLAFAERVARENGFSAIGAWLRPGEGTTLEKLIGQHRIAGYAIVGEGSDTVFAVRRL